MGANEQEIDKDVQLLCNSTSCAHLHTFHSPLFFFYAYNWWFNTVELRKIKRAEGETSNWLLLARHTFMINLIHVVLRYSTCCSMQKIASNRQWSCEWRRSERARALCFIIYSDHVLFLCTQQTILLLLPLARSPLSRFKNDHVLLLNLLLIVD